MNGSHRRAARQKGVVRRSGGVWSGTNCWGWLGTVRGIDVLALIALVCFPAALLAMILGLDRLERSLVQPSKHEGRRTRSVLLRRTLPRRVRRGHQPLVHDERAA